MLGVATFLSIGRISSSTWRASHSRYSVLYVKTCDRFAKFVVLFPFRTGMGVVIQEMVDAEAAGVLFTVNPNDGDPSKMILTANYGLGESVVSASADPDTFYIKRTSAGELSISSRIVGAKQSKVILSDDGTREEKIDEQVSSTLCLSDEKILELGQLGVYLEKAFGGPRDLEFAVSGGALYLLQVRTLSDL